jgi:hypothetical protein
MKCPAGFKYAQEQGPPLIDKCVLFTDNSKSFRLQNLPIPGPDKREQPVYAEERRRIAEALKNISSTAPFQENSAMATREYERIKSEYAGFSAVSDAGKKIKQASDKMKLPRPPVQPNPIKQEREKILNQPSMSVIQTALFTILLALIAFLLIPAQYASGLAFLILCVGTSTGIYLSTR